MTSRSSVVAVVQARMRSTRLPGKSLLELDGKPLIQHVVERITKARTVGDVILATTIDSADDPLARFASRKLKIEVVRGSEDDVLARFAKALTIFSPEIVVRVTADDPLKDPVLIDRCVDLLRDQALQYVSNTLAPSFPEGLDIEVITADALLTAHREATRKSDREHVTPFVWRQPDRFVAAQIVSEIDRSKWRWTLDTSDDARFLNALLREVRTNNLEGNYYGIIQMLELSPELLSLMPTVRRNEGYIRSITEDIYE